MKLRAALALGLGFVAGVVRPTSAQLPLQHGPAPRCAAPTAVAGTPVEHAIVATVMRVDPGLGQLEFTTATGTFLLTTTPTELHDLRVGDQVLICLHEEGSDGKAYVAEEGAAATPSIP